MCKEKKIVRTVSVASVMCALLCSLPMMAKADVGDERLEFIATTGTQWIDTGLRLNFKRSHFRVNFRVAERPTGRVALCGALSEKDNVMGYSNGTRRSFAVRLGSDVENGQICHRVYPSFTGSEDGGYRYPATGSYLEGAALEAEGTLAYALFNGYKTGGYYDSSRPDEILGEGKSFYLGNVNNAGEGLLTPSGQMPKIHWYGAKFWTDGELVGDFIPVRRDGVAGFFDTVTQRFFPSQGDEPFVAPNRVAWTGGGDASDFSDGNNWNGGAAPSTIGDVALFPAGAEIGATFSDIGTFFNKLGAVHLAGEDTLFAVTSATVDVSMYTPVFGTGVYRVASGSEAVNYKVYADSGLFDGTFEFTNAAKYVSLYVPNAAGVDGKATACFYADGVRRLELCQWARSRAHWRMTKTGQFVFSNVEGGMTGSLAFTDGYSGTLAFHANGMFDFDFDCSITNELAERRTVYLLSGRYRMGDASKPKHFGKMQIQVQNLTLNAPVAFDVQGSDYTPYNQCNIALTADGDARLLFGATNVLQDTVFLLLGYARPVSDRRKCVVDLNGFDQRIGTLCVYSSGFDANEVWNTNLVLKSESPATLTVCGSFRSDNSMVDNVNMKSVFPGRVGGALSVALDSREDVNSGPMFDGAGSVLFNNPLSDTTGSLVANRGTIRVLQSGAFSNLSSVVVSDEGIVQVDTADVGNGNEDFFVSITNATTARLSISSGVTLKANRAYANKHWLAKGRWSSTASDGVQQCAYLSGDGILEVEEYGGPIGMRVILR